MRRGALARLFRHVSSLFDSVHVVYIEWLYLLCLTALWIVCAGLDSLRLFEVAGQGYIREGGTM